MVHPEHFGGDEGKDESQGDKGCRTMVRAEAAAPEYEQQNGRV